MSYVLIIGILFVAVPIIVVEVLAHAFLIGMIRDDEDTAKLVNFVIGLIMFGLFLIVTHFVISSV